MIEEQSLRLIIDRIPGQIAIMTAGGEVEVVNRQILEGHSRVLKVGAGYG